MAADGSFTRRCVEAARLLDKYPSARTQGQLHSLDDMVVTDLARTYPTATGREVQRAMIEGEPAHLRAHIVAYRRRHALDGAQGMGEPGLGAQALDARGGGLQR